ncbi:MAG: 1-deoxy-D-xylulose-5-phosphate synthase [Rhodospirillaceae bacterium]|nr:1-deoxy-D-xylulose-5-phosphate synthase [Rhodospirillaceae bacterium]
MASPKTPLLDSIESVTTLRGLTVEKLCQVADELRAETIDAASASGGHFGAGLGVVELTVALHAAFNTPDDRLIWDVSHQAYPHKILTGRRGRIRSIRKRGGLYGFTLRAESEFDPFGAAHSSTSISAALGMAVAAVKTGSDRHAVAVIGDGAMSAGMAFEALNNIGAAGERVTVILNDNGMSIAPSVGGLTDYLKELAAKRPLLTDADIAALPAKLAADKSLAAAGSTMFDQFGCAYVGPVDGHNLRQLVDVLRIARTAPRSRAVFLHVLTEKGKGHPFDKPHIENYHALDRFDPVTKEIFKTNAASPTYTKVFATSLMEEAERDSKVIAVTAAMPSGTGLDLFQKKFPDRFYDVGIAEQHAVTFAAGMAADGLKPVAAIYSCFLQRAYDQVVHDVVLQRLPVRFALDRAGLVGADGPTHAGSFDLNYLCCLPGIVVMAPADEAELKHMVATSLAIDDAPSAFRFPRGEGPGAALPERGEVLALGKGRVLRHGSSVAILSLGARLHEALRAADEFAARGLTATVADARFAKPLDEDLVLQLAKHHEVLITLEEGAAGGFGAQVLTLLAARGALDAGLKIRTMTLPDRLVPHGKPEEQYDDAGLTARDIVALGVAALGKGWAERDVETIGRRRSR